MYVRILCSCMHTYSLPVCQCHVESADECGGGSRLAVHGALNLLLGDG